MILHKCFKALALISLLLVGASTSRSQSPRTNSTPAIKAAQVWELAIEAKGGQERLSSVRNVAVMARITTKDGPFKKKDAVYNQFFELPSKVWIWDETFPANELRIQMYRLDLGFGYYFIPKDANPLRRSTQIERVQGLTSEAQVLFLLETQWQRPRLSGYRTEKIDAKTVDVVEVFVNELRHDVYLDPVSHLPFRIDRYFVDNEGTRQLVRTFKLSDYKEFSGIWMPTKVYGRTSNGSPELLSFELNVSFDKRIFETAPSINQTSEEWKKPFSTP